MSHQWGVGSKGGMTKFCPHIFAYSVFSNLLWEFVPFSVVSFYNAVSGFQYVLLWEFVPFSIANSLRYSISCFRTVLPPDQRIRRNMAIKKLGEQQREWSFLRLFTAAIHIVSTSWKLSVIYIHFVPIFQNRLVSIRFPIELLEQAWIAAKCSNLSPGQHQGK